MIDSRFVGVSSIGPNPVQDKLYPGGRLLPPCWPGSTMPTAALAASVGWCAEQRSIDVGRLKHGLYSETDNTEGGESPGYHFFKW